MKASYKDSMQNVVFGESEKTKIRRVILDATVPVKQHSNILHWKYVVVIAALFLAGAGIYKSVKLNWENEQYGQYEFEIAASDYRTPKENVSNDFLQDAKERASANTDRKAFYEVDSWQSAVNKIGLSMLSSRWFQDNLNNSEPRVSITAECDTEGNIEKIFASALYKVSDNEENDYTVWYTAETKIGAESNTSTAKVNEATEKTYDQGIRDVELGDGTIVKVGFSSTEYTNSIMPKSGCANGNHTNKHYYGTVDATRIHQAAASHPCYCTVVYSQDWQCSSCNSSGTDRRSVLVWCPSSNKVDDETGPDLSCTFEG